MRRQTRNLAQPQHGFEAADRAPRRVERAKPAYARLRPLHPDVVALDARPWVLGVVVKRHPRVIRKVKTIAAAEENAKAHDVYMEALDFYLRAKQGISLDELSAD